MSEPVVSICIPTYNRATYLRSLLQEFTTGIHALRHDYEIVISDNASSDETESTVTEFLNKMNIRYIRRDKNYGAHDNIALLKREARGPIQLYLADDDSLIFSELNNILDQMLADPGIGVVFAPWQVYDRVVNQSLGNFYPLENDIVIPKGDYEQALTLILQNHIFPEIYVIRSDLVRAASPFTHPLAYWAFVQIAEYLSFAKVAFRKNPFYVSITRHFEGEERTQAGHTEVQEGWDRYRSGLEYLFSRIPPAAVTQDKFISTLLHVQQFVATRLNVGIRLRIHAGRDPIDTYYLACRLKAMGYPQMIPVPFDEIRCHAAAHYLLTVLATADKTGAIICLGEIPPPLLSILTARSKLPVISANTLATGQYPYAVVLMQGSVYGAAIDYTVFAADHVRIIGVNDLLMKFA